MTALLSVSISGDMYRAVPTKVPAISGRFVSRVSNKEFLSSLEALEALTSMDSCCFLLSPKSVWTKLVKLKEDTYNFETKVTIKEDVIRF